MLYGWDSSATGVVVNQEDTVLFIGDINPLYNEDMCFDEVEEILKELARFIGEKLNQCRMYVMLQDRLWILQNDKIPHPTDG